MDRINLQVTLPRGPEHYWRMMCELTRSAGGFVVSDIWQLTNSRSRTTVKGYILHCRDAGHVEIVGQTANGAVRYRVVNLNAVAPVVRRPDFSGDRGRIQQQLWTTLRSLPRFTIRELAVEASTDDVAVNDNAARYYVQALTQAGYIAVISPSEKLKARGVFRLKPSMDTGPKPPAVLKTRFVFDRNRQQAIGVAAGETEDGR